ncbi:MAG: hypothetical protein ACRETA_04535 [Gammaproteobacteria bacterium]
MDVATIPNTTVTALLAGTLTDISEPIWGKQVCLKLDEAINGVDFMGYLHLAAVNPLLNVGQHIAAGTVLGWSGGCTQSSQYGSTYNPTGTNFLNAISQSSQPQTGIALMYGPVYGSGAGWNMSLNPDPKLDPTSIVKAAIAAYKQGEVMIPSGWDDNGTELSNPINKFVVSGAFRTYLMSQGNWYPNNVPLQNQGQLEQLEFSNTTLGGGTSQVFVMTRLEQTPSHDNGQVFEGYLGQEVLAVYSLLQQAGSGVPPVAPALLQLIADINAAMQKFGSAINPPTPPPSA